MPNGKMCFFLFRKYKIMKGNKTKSAKWQGSKRMTNCKLPQSAIFLMSNYYYCNNIFFIIMIIRRLDVIIIF